MTHPLLLTKEEVVSAGKANSYPYSVLSSVSRYMLNDNLRGAKLYHSDVYYVREAMHKRTGWWLPLPDVEKAMRAEGWTERSYRKF
jgi:hypothetical protein